MMMMMLKSQIKGMEQYNDLETNEVDRKRRDEASLIMAQE